jgi:uncharacterized protein with NRDE domain
LLCLELLRARDPSEARALLRRERGSIYRPFNLLFASAEEAFAAYNRNEEIKTVKLNRGLHVLSNSSLFDLSSEKLDRAHKLFSRARQPLRTQIDPSLPKGGDPSGPLPSFIPLLREILSDHTLREGSEEPKEAICVHAGNYGTVSSSVIVFGRGQKRFYFYHTSAPPCRGEYQAARFLDIL